MQTISVNSFMEAPKVTVKDLQKFFLERKIRVKFRVHPVRDEITFRVSWKDYKFLRDDIELARMRMIFKFIGWKWVMLPLLMPWECREQIAAYTYLD